MCLMRWPCRRPSRKSQSDEWTPIRRTGRIRIEVFESNQICIVASFWPSRKVGRSGGFVSRRRVQAGKRVISLVPNQHFSLRPEAYREPQSEGSGLSFSAAQNGPLLRGPILSRKSLSQKGLDRAKPTAHNSSHDQRRLRPRLNGRSNLGPPTRRAASGWLRDHP